MKNYNELINKPRINNIELIGDVTVSGLPEVTTADIGKTVVVGEDGKWTVASIKGGTGFDATFNKSNIMTITEGE